MVATKVLVTAASRNGGTLEIARAIGSALARRGCEVTVMPPESVDSVLGYDAVVLGSAVYNARWLTPAWDVVRRLGPQLTHRPVWLFSSGPVGDTSRPIVQRMGRAPVDVADITGYLVPRGHRVFRGVLDRRHLPLRHRVGVVLVGGLEGDFRNWPEIDQWAHDIARQLSPTWQREPVAH